MQSATTGVSPVRPATLLLAGAVALLAVVAGVAFAVPALAAPDAGSETTTSSAAAAVDPARPTARLVHGPNCSDGYVRVEVTNGTADHTVTLQYDGADVGTAVTLAPGEETLLEGPEVDGGERVDVQVAVSGGDGAESPLPLGDYTRPTQADCDAAGNPQPTSSAPPSTPSSTSPSTSPSTTRPTTPTTTSPSTPSTASPSTGGPSATSTAPPASSSTGPSTPSTTPRPTTGAPSTSAGTGTTGAGSATSPPGGAASAGQVAPGSVVTIRGTGFTPGEPVTVTLVGAAAPLATVTADEQGRVEAVVQIPQDVVLGPAVVQLVGEESAAATQVALDVAARDSAPVTGSTPWPLVAAGLVLLAVAAALVAATRRPRPDDWQPPAGSA
ncbi:hypothetical protein TEK04_16030 [Klenkia sp. LSe6-5]|uniref:IPT/TIG domain-containing protein n=1 Tax=Klenkia sesuvii TaxID=3103137 RepID=A0ABU8DWQ8_9ACTN